MEEKCVIISENISQVLIDKFEKINHFELRLNIISKISVGRKRIWHLGL